MARSKVVGFYSKGKGRKRRVIPLSAPRLQYARVSGKSNTRHSSKETDRFKRLVVDKRTEIDEFDGLIEQRRQALENLGKQKPFFFEVTDYTYPTGFATVIGRMKLEKKYPDGSVEVWMIDVNRAPKDKMFYHSGRGIESIDQLAKPIFPYPTFQEFYEIRQSFHGPSTRSDPLGGFQSGLSGDVTDKGKLDAWLKEKEAQGFRQVPYIKR